MVLWFKIYILLGFLKAPEDKIEESSDENSVDCSLLGGAFYFINKEHREKQDISGELTSVSC